MSDSDQDQQADCGLNTKTAMAGGARKPTLPRSCRRAQPATDHSLVLSCLLTLYTAVMSFEILFPFGLWVFEPDGLFNHSQLV